LSQVADVYTDILICDILSFAPPSFCIIHLDISTSYIQIGSDVYVAVCRIQDTI
jgi:hypothetical protein